MLFSIHRFAYRRNIARHAGRRLVVNAHDCFNGPVAITRKSRGHHVRVDAVPPIAWYKIDNDSKLLRQLAPEHRKMTSLKHEYIIAWRERVHDRGFPSTCPTGGKNKNLSVSSIKYLLHPFEALATQAGEFFAAVVNRRTVDCSKDAIWNIRRPWDLEKMPACFVGWTRIIHFRK